MEVILLMEDDLKHLEHRFGPVVRRMGPWNSDGVFGYATVPLPAVESAAGRLECAQITGVLHRLHTPERTRVFIKFLEDGGAVLVEQIVAAYGSIAGSGESQNRIGEAIAQTQTVVFSDRSYID